MHYEHSHFYGTYGSAPKFIQMWGENANLGGDNLCITNAPCGCHDDNVMWGFITTPASKIMPVGISTRDCYYQVSREAHHYTALGKAIRKFCGEFISATTHRLEPTPYYADTEAFQEVDFKTLIRRNPNGTVTCSIVDNTSGELVLTFHAHQPMRAISC